MTLPVRIALLIFVAGPVLAQGQAAPQSFCQRLAPQLRMKLVPATNGIGPVWRTNTASFGMHLFGGSTATALNVSPVDRTNAAEFVRLDNACAVVSKGAICKLEGPAKIEIATRSVKTSAEMGAGERADLEIRNTVITCRDHT